MATAADTSDVGADPLQFGHPFLESNGRVGRLLITLLLCHAGVLREPLLYLSLYLKRHRPRYDELLDPVRHEGDWEAWLEFFAEGVAEAAQCAVDTAVRLTELFALDRSRIEGTTGRRVGSALRGHEALKARPPAFHHRSRRDHGVVVPGGCRGGRRPRRARRRARSVAAATERRVVSSSGFLLDTNVVSEALWPRPDSRVLAWLRANEARAWLSLVTIGEIEAGILGARDPRRAELLRVWLDEVLIPQFAHRFLPIDAAVARRWGERTAAARAGGTPVGAVDMLIAATAAQHGLAVATRNGRDLAQLGVAVVDPWTVAEP